MDEQTLLILTSPPASGKTYWIESLILELQQYRVLVISPLRALANECKNKWGEKVIVQTPEEWLTKKVSAPVVIFDEFHLNFYWGDTFRPILWEVFYQLCSEAELSILLTATLNQQMLFEIERYHSHFNKILWVDFGNQVLKNRPSLYLKVPSRSWLEQLIFANRTQGTALLFCHYRQEVLDWKRKLEASGFNVWTCIGGEAGPFTVKVSNETPPDFIVATTVLSHGVNLPQISTIYFLYRVSCIDFWIQMVARGGRRGESFQVFSLEKPFGIPWSYWTNLMGILKYSLVIKRMNLLRQFKQWFLKD